MPEFLQLLPPDEARSLFLSYLSRPVTGSEIVAVPFALGRVLAEDIHAPHPLPDFPRSTVDGFAVHARDTHGASDSLPGYLKLAGEVPMGDAPAFKISPGQCGLIHTGGMVPEGADAVIMLEHTQSAQEDEIEVLRPVAEGENVIRVGEDVAQGQLVQAMGSWLRPAEIGGLMALGITEVRVRRKIRVGLISTGDEVIEPAQLPRPGQVRDVNSYTLSALIEGCGGTAIRYGIIADEFEGLRTVSIMALLECDMVIITAGSSASTRDMTADVIRSLGRPGVLIHGINTRPGKPTILGICEGKAVIGLPGNPVSALVNGYLFVVPVIEKLFGAQPRHRPSVLARVTINLPSQAGREDWWPVKLLRSDQRNTMEAEPIFGKSNLIFTLAAADGLLRIPPEATGLSAGETVEVFLI